MISGLNLSLSSRFVLKSMTE